MALDWNNLPSDAAPVALNPAVLDGTWQPSSRFSLEERVLAVRMRVPPVAAHHGLPEDYEWCITLRDVDSLRAVLFHALPGSKANHQPNGVEMSASWDEVSAALALRHATFLDGAIVANDKEAALHLGLRFDKNQPLAAAQLWARGASVAITGSDGKAYSAEQLAAMGTASWDAFRQMYLRG